jgi:hypothetical protein
MWDLKILIICVLIVSMSLNCSSSRNDVKEEQDEFPPPQPPPVIHLSPESAKVEAYILEYNQKEDRLLCRVKIEKVVAYGSATPPLSSGTPILAGLSLKMLEHNAELRKNINHRDHLFNMTIEVGEGRIGITQNEPQIWHIVQLK